MTWLYMTRADGEWARYDFKDFWDVVDEDLWTYIGRTSPELWAALPGDADFVVGDNDVGFHPMRFETFGRMEDLVAWVKEGME